ncbi:MAG TPA: carboxypeptidase-like regulatory domain-containing protein [Chloroflexia bacterium]|nr:carboxypeptidase-like regulatory domain-containing protein [Chloroflexia bacterium]
MNQYNRNQKAGRQRSDLLQREEPGLPPAYSSEEEASWHQEKTGVTSAEALRWQLEKLGVSSEEEARAYYEKMGLDPDEAKKWFREKQGKRRFNKGLVFGLASLALLLVAALVLGLLFNSSGSKTGGEVQANSTQVTAQPTRTPTVAGAGDVTPANLPVITVAAPALPKNEAERILQAGQTAFNASRWEEVVAALSTLGPNDSTYEQARPLLVKAYYELGMAELKIDNSNNLASAEKTANFLRAANKLNPEYSGLKTALDRAELYAKARAQYDNQQCNFAVNPLGELYNQIKSENAAAKYRDTAELYYNCLIIVGELTEKQDNKAAWQEAKQRYTQAQGIDVADKSLAQGHLEAVERKINPPTPTPLPTPTPRPPTPTPTPGICSPGGSGSNFFAYQAAGTGLGNAADQGKSNITGSVVDRNHNGIGGVVVVASSGGYRYTAVTGGNGSYQFGPVLGKGVWTLQVAGVPGKTICTSVSASVQMNGQAGSIGNVSFTESAPG